MTSAPISIAFLQMDCREGDRARNRAQVARAAADAARAGARILALPELWCSGYNLAESTREPGWEEEFAALARLSRESGLAILGGSLLEPSASRPANCAVACENGGEQARYRKQHLFRPLDEHRYLRAGDEHPAIFDLAGVRAAMVICYDLRFPEEFRPLAVGGVELIHVPAQWPRARIHHWRALLVARAIESQCYVLGVNRLGKFGDLEFPGNSLLVAPGGELLVDAGEKPGLFHASIDGADVRKLRASFPVLKDRRADLYPLPGERDA